MCYPKSPLKRIASPNKPTPHFTSFPVFQEKHFLTVLQPVSSCWRGGMNWSWQSRGTSLKQWFLHLSASQGLRPAWTQCAVFSFIFPVLQGCQRNSVPFKWCLSSKNCIPNRYTLYRGVASPTTKMSPLSRASWDCSKAMAAVGRSVHSDREAERQRRVVARLQEWGTG